MASGSGIAQAYIQIIPTSEGIKGKLEEMLGGEAESAGKSAGGKFAGTLGKVLKAGSAVATAVTGATAAMTGALVSGANDVAAYGDQVDKMSQKLGLSATAYQQWDYVLGQAGADINSMSTGMKTLTNKLDDAKNGSESAQAMFAQLGLSMDDLSNMSREDVFESVIYGFQGMADSTERAALANDLFGKSGQELTPLFNSSVEDTKALIAASSELGFVMSDEAVKASADYNDAMDTMKRTIGGVKNSMIGEFLPSITTVMDGITELFSGGDGVGKISEGIQSFISTISASAPKFLESGSRIILAIGDAIISNLPQLISAAGQTIMTLANGIIQQLPMIIETGLQILVSLANGIAENLPTMIPTIVSVVLQIVDTLTDPGTLSALIDASIAIIIGLADGLIEALPQLLEKAPEIVMNLMSAIIENAPKLLEASFNLIVKLGEGIVKNFPQVLAKGKEIVMKVGEGILALRNAMREKAIELMTRLITGIVENFPKIVAKGKEIVSKLKDAVVGAVSSLLSAGRNLVEGIWNGISGALGWIKDKIRGWVGNVTSFLKSLFGIHSPSTVMRDQVGKNLALGIGLGFQTEMTDVERMMRDSIPDVSALVGPLDVSAGFRYSTAPQYNYGGVTIQILGRGKDADTLARELQAALDRRVAVWA